MLKEFKLWMYSIFEVLFHDIQMHSKMWKSDCPSQQVYFILQFNQSPTRTHCYCFRHQSELNKERLLPEISDYISAQNNNNIHELDILAYSGTIKHFCNFSHNNYLPSNAHYYHLKEISSLLKSSFILSAHNKLNSVQTLSIALYLNCISKLS